MLVNHKVPHSPPGPPGLPLGSLGQEVNAQESARRERVHRNWRAGRAKAQPAAIIQELPGMFSMGFHGVSAEIEI